MTVGVDEVHRVSVDVGVPVVGQRVDTDREVLARRLGAIAVRRQEPGLAGVVAFVTPVWTAQSGARVSMSFMARRSDTSRFTGTVHYSIGTPGSAPLFTGTTTADANGDGWVSFEVGTSPVHIVAYADRAGVGAAGDMDATEVAGTTVVVGINV